MNLQEVRQSSAEDPRKSAGAGQSRVGTALNLIFRFRYWLHVLIYAGAFAISMAGAKGSGTQRVWLALPEAISARFELSLHIAIVGVTALAVVLASAGAVMRTWGTAYLGAGMVFDPALHSGSTLAAGPLRHMRNPLYLGTILHTLALAMLMSWVGAIAAIGAIVALQFALIVSEERFLAQTLGEVYSRYKREVPRFLPRFSHVGKGGLVQPRWPQAFAGEIYMWGVAVSFAVFGSRYDALLLGQGVLVSFGLSIVVRGLMKTKSPLAG